VSGQATRAMFQMKNGRLWLRIWRCAARTLCSGLSVARRVQRPSIRGQDRQPSGASCPTIFSMDSGVPTDAAMDRCAVFRNHGREDLRILGLLREFAGRKGQPTAMILDSRTLQSTPGIGRRGGYDGAKRRKGSKVSCGSRYAGDICWRCHVTTRPMNRTRA